MIQHYLKLAFRHIWKHKVQNGLSILGITIGLICFSITTYFIRQMNNEYTEYPHYKHMAQLAKTNGKSSYKNYQIAPSELLTLSNNRVAGIEKIGWRTGYGSNFTFVKSNGQEVPFNLDFANINPDFGEIFSFQSVYSKTTQLKNGDVLISKSCARKVFGEENPIGKNLYFSKASDDTSPINHSVITHVINDLPGNYSEQPDIYFVYDQVPNKRHSLDVAVLLSEDAGISDINQRLKAQFPELNTEYKEYPVIKRYHNLLEDTDMLLGQSLVTLIASLILIAAMINFLKFNISSFYNRTRELSLRKSLGSGSTGLFCILFTEISILLLLTLLATYSMTEICLPILFSLLPESFRNSDKVKINNMLLFKQQTEYLIGLLILCAVIIRIAVRRISHASLIKGIYGGRGYKHGIRNFMLGAQICICLFFIGGTNYMFQAYQEMEKKRYNTLSEEECERIWKVAFSEIQLKGHEEEIVSRIKGLAGVEDILFLFTGNSNNYITPEDNKVRGVLTEVSENYYQFMNLPVQGKPAYSENSVVITRSLAKQLEADGIKGSVTLDGKSYQISGIVEQLPFEQLGNNKSHLEFYAFTGTSQSTSPQFYVKCAQGNETAIGQKIMEIIRTYLPATIPYYMETLAEGNHNKYKGLELIGQLFMFLSAISLIITILGIYSAISMDTESRQKEVAIRKINGAGPEVIARLFGKLYIRLFLVASACAIPLLILIQTLAEVPFSGLYHPVFWLTNLSIVAGIIFITVFYRIRLISKLNPADIIKSE